MSTITDLVWGKKKRERKDSAARATSLAGVSEKTFRARDGIEETAGGIAMKVGPIPGPHPHKIFTLRVSSPTRFP